MSFIKEHTLMFALACLSQNDTLSPDQINILREIYPRTLKSKLNPDDFDSNENIDRVFEYCIENIEKFLQKEGL